MDRFFDQYVRKTDGFVKLARLTKTDINGDEMQDVNTFMAFNRFGLGLPPKTKQLPDPKAWVKQQIQIDQYLPKRLASFQSSKSILTDLFAADFAKDKEAEKKVRGEKRDVFQKEVMATIQHRVSTQTPFAERMIMFWSNHFTVSRTKKTIGPAIAAYEREAIRPHVFGKFEDMLIAVISHPVMLSYLDNAASIGRQSTIGRRRKKLPNENLAREILELHTLGVHGGYEQEDIVEFAKALTGWSHGGLKRIARRSGRPVHGGFAFVEPMHEPGSKTVLGKKYKQDGHNEVLAILHDIARHPSTAHFIATKLARHFIADDPPKDAIETLAKTFRDTDGDLAKVSAALVDLDAAWQTPLAKVKSPYELMISTFSILQPPRIDRRMVRLPLKSMGQEPYYAPSPAGWPDTTKEWIAPESLMRRIEWVHALTERVETPHTPSEFLELALGPMATGSTKFMALNAPSGASAKALILASPEFQRR